jgi:hypothetical protein
MDPVVQLHLGFKSGNVDVMKKAIDYAEKEGKRRPLPPPTPLGGVGVLEISQIRTGFKVSSDGLKPTFL